MGVEKYRTGSATFWRVDEWVTLPDGRVERFRKRKIPTREQAMALISKLRTSAFEGRFFERMRPATMTVAEAWTLYEPVARRDNDAFTSDQGRTKHLVRHLGERTATTLSQRDIDEYRTARLGETTVRGSAPAPATLDREVELLKRMLTYAVKCGELASNPLAGVKLLRKPNVRRTVVTEEIFAKVYTAASRALKPILLTAYDTGMRKQEVLGLRWRQVELEAGVIRLAAGETKSDEPRVIYLTTRTREALKRIHKGKGKRSEYVFVNPSTGEPWQELRKGFATACAAAGLEDAWFHDLRRSFVTNARRRGVPESVVMRMSGHKTRNVFDRYNIVSEEDLQEAVKRIEAGAAGHDLGKTR